MLKIIDLFSGAGGGITYPIDLDGYMIEDSLCINSVFYDWLCDTCDPVRSEEETCHMFEDAYCITADILGQSRPLHRYEDYRVRACNATCMGEGANRRIFDDTDTERENCVMSMVYHLLKMQNADKNTRKRQLMDKILEHLERRYYISLNRYVQQAEVKMLDEKCTASSPVQRQETTPAPIEKATPTIGRGARKKTLFGNEQNTEKWARLFKQYLKLHHMSNARVDTSGDNFLTRALLSFLCEWQRQGIVGRNNVCGPACARFLQESCNLTFDVKLKAYEDRITRILNRKAKQPSYIDDVQKFVSQHTPATNP